MKFAQLALVGAAAASPFGDAITHLQTVPGACTSDADCTQPTTEGASPVVCGSISVEVAGVSGDVQICGPKDQCGKTMTQNGVEATFSCGGGAGVVIGVIVGVVVVLGIAGGCYYKRKNAGEGGKKESLFTKL